MPYLEPGIYKALFDLAQADRISASALDSLLPQLLAQEAQDPDRLQALGLDPEALEPALHQRFETLRLAYSDLLALSGRQRLPWESLLPSLWSLWLPWALQLAQQRQALGRPLIQGILGSQGAGKTTLGAVLRCLLAHLGYHAVSWSLDDLYKTYADRQHLLQTDPRLIWRGPPGTHDVDLGLDLLTQIRDGDPSQTVLLPSFDKSLQQGAGDRTTPTTATGIDIVLFEGWFVGAIPVDPQCFAPISEGGTILPDPIVTNADRQFAADCNERLRDYLPLWALCDRLTVLYLTDYQLSKTWRRQAEQQMRATGKPGMSDAEIDAFVDYFWKALHPELFIQPFTERSPRLQSSSVLQKRGCEAREADLTPSFPEMSSENQAGADLVVEILADRSLGRIY